MNRQTRTTLLLLVTLVAGPTYRAMCAVPNSANLKVDISLPAASLDLTDLDARDKFNRPIRHAAEARILERLFTTNLNRLLMFNLTETKQQLWSILSSHWHILAGFLGRQFNRFNEKFEAWISSKKFSDEFKKYAASVLGWAPAPHRGVTARSTNFLNPVSPLITSTCLLL